MLKLIHQSWKTSSVASVYGTLRQTWLKDYEDWTHVLWTDEDNAELVKELYPQYLELYRAFPAEIYRADLARCLYMHTFGGIYVDLDFDSYRSLEPLLAQHLSKTEEAVFLGRMKDPFPFNQNNENNSMPNAFLASTPLHPFWLEYLTHIKQAWGENELIKEGECAREQVEYITGPVVLRRAYQIFTSNINEATSSKHPVLVLSPEYIYPFAWYATEDDEDHAEERLETLGDSQAFDLESFRAKYDDGIAYACYWGESWRENGWKPERDTRY